VTLEQRYRRLLALYPERFRREYGEEMITTLLAAARNGQNRPSVRDTLSMAGGAAVQHMRRWPHAFASSSWRAALAGAGVFLAIVLAGAYAHPVVVAIGWHLRATGASVRPAYWFDPVSQLGIGALVPAIGWLMIAIAAIAGWRAAAALGAWLGVIGQALLAGSTGQPAIVVNAWWRLVLALTVAAALSPSLRRPAAGRTADAAATARAVWPAAVGALAFALGGAVDVAAAHIDLTPDSGSLGLFGGNYSIPFVAGTIGSMVGLPGALGAAAFALGMLVTVFRFRPGVRLRVLVVAGPTVVTAYLVHEGFRSYLTSSNRFASPIPLAVPQWLALFLVPAVTFGIGVAWVNRGAQIRRDAQLGRAIRAAGDPTRCAPAVDVPRSTGDSAEE